jgi:hypothetical protein
MTKIAWFYYCTVIHAVLANKSNFAFLIQVSSQASGAIYVSLNAKL